MEKKLDIYRRYKDELGISLTKNERKKVLSKFDETGVEVLLGRKLFNHRQVVAAIRIQSNWRMVKVRKWYSLINMLRNQSAQRIQNAWKNFRAIRIIPHLMKKERREAAIMI